jgi:Tfp pilus assembly protein PilV
MKTFQSGSRERGVGLVEVMLALALAAFGILAIAAMQGWVGGISGDDKARGEAVELAQQTMEDLRVLVVLDTWGSAAEYADINGFYTDPGGTISGVNASFSRSWKVDDLSNPARKEIIVKVSWVDSSGVTQNVFANSIVSFKDPSKSVTLASGGGSGIGKVDAPNAGAASYDPVADIDTSISPTETIITDDGDTYKLRKDQQGNDIVTQIKSGETSEDIVLTVLTSLITIEGEVWYEGDINSLSVLTSDFGVCAFPFGRNPSSGVDAGGYSSASYKCYLGQGWRGKVGIVGFGKTDDPDFCPAVARTYIRYVHNQAGDAVVKHEGIDGIAYTDDNNVAQTGYDNQDFFVLSKNSLDSTNTCVTYASSFGLTDAPPNQLIIENPLTSSNIYTVSGIMVGKGQGSVADVEIGIQDPSTGGVDTQVCFADIAAKKNQDTTYTCSIGTSRLTDNGDGSYSGTFIVTTSQEGATVEPSSFDMTFLSSDSAKVGPIITATKTGN